MSAQLTTAQFNALRWFARHGGRGRFEGRQILMANKVPSTGEDIVLSTFLHLVAAGCIAGENNELFITDYGRRHIELTETERLI